MNTFLWTNKTNDLQDLGTLVSAEGRAVHHVPLPPKIILWKRQRLWPPGDKECKVALILQQQQFCTVFLPAFVHFLLIWLSSPRTIFSLRHESGVPLLKPTAHLIFGVRGFPCVAQVFLCPAFQGRRCLLKHLGMTQTSRLVT